MKLPRALWVSVVLLAGPTAATATVVTDPALAPRSPAGMIAVSTVNWVPGQFSTTKSVDIWTVEPDGSSLRQFVGPGAQVPQFSPDGQWLYFESKAITGQWGVYRSSVDGSATYNLTPDASLGQEAFGATFAANSPRMLFTSVLDGVARVGTMDLDGGNARIVNAGLGYHYMASLSPNGSEIVFSHTDDNYRLKRMNYDGTNVVSLAPSLPQSYMGQFTPDGQTIVFLNVNGDLYSVKRDGADLKRLTTGNNYTTFYITSPTGQLPTNPDEQHGSTDVPSISPDGSQIAYVSAATGLPQVYVMSIDGTNQQRVTDLPLACGRVQWSPEGDQLAFVSFDGAGRSQLFLMDSTGGTPEQMTHFTDRSVHFIDWSPIPEPGSFTLLIAGSLLIAGWTIVRRVARVDCRLGCEL
jgi:TolB protein